MYIQNPIFLQEAIGQTHDPAFAKSVALINWDTNEVN
jgi:hypothetical protein